MRRLLGSLAALTAALVGGCFDDRGVAIVVDVADTGATEIELFVAARACEPKLDKIDCTQLTPPGAALPVPGTIWIQDSTTPTMAEVRGTKATIRLEASPTNDEDPNVLERVFVIARDASGTPVGAHTFEKLEVPKTGARLLELSLAKAGALGDIQLVSRAAGEYAQIWESPTTRCLAIEHRTDDGVTRDFVVRSQDPDCDGIDSNSGECNLTAAKGATGRELDEDGDPAKAECLKPQPVGDDDRAICFVGYTGCQDDANAQGCYPAALPLCAPAAVCDRCTEPERSCFEDIANTKSQYIECKLRPGAEGKSCSRSTTIALDKYLPAGCGEAPLITSLDSGSPGEFGFAESAAFGIIDLHVSRAKTLTGGCALTLSWSIDGSSGGPAPGLGAIKLATKRGKALVPISFPADLSPVQTCEEKFSCTLMNDNGAPDSMWACVAP